MTLEKCLTLPLDLSPKSVPHFSSLEQFHPSSSAGEEAATSQHRKTWDKFGTLSEHAVHVGISSAQHTCGLPSKPK